MIYLDNAATSFPKPASVERAVIRALKTCANPGRGTHAPSIAAANALYEAREALASLFSVSDPFRFAFTLNATDALNMAIHGLVKQSGHVITTVLEHNSVLRPLNHICVHRDARLDILAPEHRCDAVSAEQVRAAIQGDTCLVVINHASNVTGAVQPVEQIAAVCREAGVPLLVDGSQAAGHMKINLEELGADFYAFPGHKALLGPQGTGALYVKEGRELPAFRMGGTGSESMLLTQPTDMPEHLEAGTHNTHGLAGLAAGVRYLIDHEPEIHENERSLTKALRDGLMDMKGMRILGGSSEPQSPVVSFTLNESESGALADMLGGYGFAVRGGLHCAPLVHGFYGTKTEGAVRVSPGHANTRSDVSKFLNMMRLIAK